MHIFVFCKCVDNEIILFAILITHYLIMANFTNITTYQNFQQAFSFPRIYFKNLISTDTNRRTANMIFSPAEICPYINTKKGSHNPILINSSLTHSRIAC